MEDAPVQDTTTPWRGGDGGRLYNGSFVPSAFSNFAGASHGYSSAGSVNGVNGVNGVASSPYSSMAGINGTYARQQPPRPVEPCLFTGCTASSSNETPFCAQHLPRISSKTQSGPETTTATAPPPRTTALHDPKPTPTSPGPILGNPGQARNSALASEPAVTYLRRKTAPSSGPRPSSLPKAPSMSSSTPSIGRRSIFSNGAPSTPSPRIGSESTGGSYFVASHTAPGPKRADIQANGNNSQKHGSITNGSESILTPSESPPTVCAAHDSRKRPRTEDRDRDSGQPANGVNKAIHGGNIAPSILQSAPTAQPSSAHKERSDVPMPDIIQDPLLQMISPSQELSQNSKDRAAMDASDGTPRNGLRLFLLRRMEERKRATAANGGNRTHLSLAPPMTFSLDTYIYNQGPDVAPLPPPPEAVIAPKESLEAVEAAVPALLPSAYLSSTRSDKPEFVYAHIDPRVHWTRARPKEWHEAKQKEIAARGGRKANFGMAAQRAAAARRQERAERPSERPTETPNVPLVWQGELPPDVVHKTELLSMLGRFAQDETARQTKRVTKPSSRSKGR